MANTQQAGLHSVWARFHYSNICTVSVFVVYCLPFVCPFFSAVNVELTEAEEPITCRTLRVCWFLSLLQLLDTFNRRKINSVLRVKPVTSALLDHGLSRPRLGCGPFEVWV